MTLAPGLAAVSAVPLASLILVKGTVLLLAAILVSAVIGRRTVAERSNWWVAGFTALTVMPLLALVLPGWAPMTIAVDHTMLRIPIDARAPGISGAALLTLVWLAGTTWWLGRLCVGVLLAWRITRAAAAPADPSLRGLIERAARAVGTRVPVRVLLTPKMESPAVFGGLLARPTILLPAAAATWPEEQLFGVLCHEFEHVRRRDWSAYLLEQLVGAIYWPNPLLHVALSRAALAREMRADRAVLKAGVAPEAFAARLIEVARACTRGHLVGRIALASTGELDRRVRALFAPGGGTEPRPVATRFLEFSLMLICLAVAALSPLTCPPPPAAQSTTTCVQV